MSGGAQWLVVSDISMRFGDCTKLATRGRLGLSCGAALSSQVVLGLREDSFGWLVGQSG